MKRRVLLFVSALLMVLTVAAAAQAQVTPLRPAPTPEDTDSVLILHGAFTYPGYWWDHTDLTVAVQAHPNVAEESLAAVRQAITDWDYALRLEFDGLITFTDVTDDLTAKHKADIVLHYNPTAGGTVFGGYAVCGSNKNTCPNVIVRSDLPPSLGLDPYSPQYLYYVTMHELGHALGLVEVLQPHLTELALRHAVGQSAGHERRRRRREEHLPAVTRRADPRGAMDVDSDVALLADDGFAGVEAHAHAKGVSVRPRIRVEGTLRRDRRGNRVAGAFEAEEECVALRVDLLTPSGSEGVADHAAVLGKRVGVSVAELLEQLGRALDVGEDEGDGAAVQHRHALSLSSSEPWARRRRTRGLASLTISSR